jgi:hypothetical protein
VVPMPGRLVTIRQRWEEAFPELAATHNNAT